MKTWDILVPTFHARTGLYLELLDQLDAQIRPGVRVIAARDDRTEPVGLKLQRLMEASTADYVCVCADDAKLHPQYVELVHDAMQSDPDVIGFILQLWNADGPCDVPQRHSIAFHGIPELWDSRGCYWGAHWCNLGNWMPVRRSIGCLVRYGGHGDEDLRWTQGVIGTGLLKREVFLNEVLVMPQVLDEGFFGEWVPVVPSPDPVRSFVTYI